MMTSRKLLVLSVLSLMALSAMLSPLAAQQAPGRRMALVVGNSAYAANPLKNPVNDAEDIAAALREAGFEVALIKDADQARFEKAVRDFAAGLQGADTGLFYYAGHGVQVDGINYLIPVSPRIDDAADVKVRAVAVDSVVGRMESSGVATALVFLDSCRDNPFPGAIRSGTRGLAVVATPRTRNSLIAYATSPGDTAADGSGRNGVFSGAVLEQLKNPATELGAMMRNVKAAVAASTNNRQNPRVDDGMKDEFYFVDPQRQSAAAQARADAAAAELAALEQELATRQAQIAANKNASERQKLDLEQQRQQALANAKKLEAENLANLAKVMELARIQAAARDKELADAGQRQDELAKLAQARKAQLEQLAKDAQSDNPDVLIETVERLEKAIVEIDAEYARALATSKRQLEATWQVKFNELAKAQPEPWEGDVDFAQRQQAEKAAAQRDKVADLARIQSETESQRQSQTANMRAQLSQTLSILQAKRWVLSNSSIAVRPGDYDRNSRLWPFQLSSSDPVLPLSDLVITADLSRAADLKAAYTAIDTAVKANALAGELEWGIERQQEKGRYAVVLHSARLRNIADNSLVAILGKQGIVALFLPGARDQAVGPMVKVSLKASDPNAEIQLNGRKVGTGIWQGELHDGSHAVRAIGKDGHVSLSLILILGKHQSVDLVLKPYRIGDIGPAGGYIFYDKGSYSKSWRYLEVAPIDQSTRFDWGPGESVNTQTSIGSGKANTAAIIAARGGSGNYAASICDQLVLGGYSDWFLPSKDELAALYANLKKLNLGGFSSYEPYWSSSQSSRRDAWMQYLVSGHQFADYKGFNNRIVRAIRAF